MPNELDNEIFLFIVDNPFPFHLESRVREIHNYYVASIILSCWLAIVFHQLDLEFMHVQHTHTQTQVLESLFCILNCVFYTRRSFHWNLNMNFMFAMENEFQTIRFFTSEKILDSCFFFLIKTRENSG